MKKLVSLRNKKGFTLVELIVVIVIIAILAAALVTSLIGYINKAKNTNALVEANNVYTACQAYVSEQVGTGKLKTTAVSASDAAMIKQVNDYLGTTVATDKNITTLTVDTNATITAFKYTATNGIAVSYAAGTGWVVPAT